jgi:post-segregation antitoxin (ccd killing protein)
MVDVNYNFFRDKLNKKSVDRVVTLPRYLNAAAKENGINVSQILQEALKNHLGMQ